MGQMHSRPQHILMSEQAGLNGVRASKLSLLFWTLVQSLLYSHQGFILDAGEAAALLWLDAGDRKPTPPMDCSNSNMVAPPPPGDPPFPPIPRDRVGLRTAPEE